MDQENLVNFKQPNAKKKKNIASKIIVGVLFFIMLCVLGFVIQFKVRYEPRTVVGWSMLSTYNMNTVFEDEQGDVVFVNKYANIKNGDITVLYSNKLKDYIIKRCVASEGQSVNIIGVNKIGSCEYGEATNQITINVYSEYYLVVDGVRVDESAYVRSAKSPSEIKEYSNNVMENEFRSFCYWKYKNDIFDANEVEKEIILAEDELFALGDNRTGSTDSSAVGPFKQSEIIGRVDFVIEKGTNFVQEWLQKFLFVFIIKP